MLFSNTFFFLIFLLITKKILKLLYSRIQPNTEVKVVPAAGDQTHDQLWADIHNIHSHQLLTMKITFWNLLLSFLAFSRKLAPKVLCCQNQPVVQWTGSVNVDHHRNCASSLIPYCRTIVLKQMVIKDLAKVQLECQVLRYANEKP